MMGQQGGKVDLPSYQYTIVHDGKLVKMVLKSPDCNSEMPIANPRCLSAMLLALSEDSNVDLIAISHYVEIQYGKETVELLKKMTKVIADLDRLMLRGPSPMDETIPVLPTSEEAAAQGISLDKAKYERIQAIERLKRRLDCSHCPFNPESLYKTMKIQFISDLSNFYNMYSQVIQGLMSNTQPPECGQCIYLTASDIIYIDDILKDLRQYVLSIAYRIVEEPQPKK